jgi:hypothetical protein
MVLDAFVIMPNHMHGIIVITEMDVNQNGRGEAGETRYASQSLIPKSPASPLHPDKMPHQTPTINPGKPKESTRPNGTIPGFISASRGEAGDNTSCDENEFQLSPASPLVS